MINLSQASLEEAMNKLYDNTAFIIQPTHIQVSPEMIRLAHRILRKGWHYKSTPRWRYLVRRGARHAL